MTQPGSIIPERSGWFPRTQRVGVAAAAYGWTTGTVEGSRPTGIGASLQKTTAALSGLMIMPVTGTVAASATKTVAAFGGLVFTGAPPAYKNSSTAEASNIAIPSHAVGDLLIICAWRYNSNTTPSKPTASGSVPAWVDIDNNTGSNGVSMRTARFTATATNHTSGTWANATEMAVVVVSGANSTTPIGGHAESGGTSLHECIAPAVTMTDTSGRSLLIHFFGRGNATWTTWSAAPSGYTKRASTVGFYDGICIDTKNSSTSDGSVIQDTNGSATVGYRGASIEILD